ncbi:uncharacterized protein LOC127713988 [Mytilus californianus]|uniref:uncharacterized protein LOC127713988 n=1 Tax=Mytilus californianus TaxID=6549 RepID=UPI002247CA41|nr:uncharacterized protein LOC127713988 [Mytilus californianus]
MSDYDDISPIVIDNGSDVFRAGFAGDEAPVCGYSTGMDSKGYYVGEEAQKRRGLLSLDYPIEHGIVTNWDDMELICHDICKSNLEVPLKEHPCLLTEPPLNPNITERKWHRCSEKYFKRTYICGFEVVREMKEKLCYVAEDYSKEVILSECFPGVDKSYELSDGNLITIGQERFRCPGMLFRPSKDIGSDGIHKSLYDSILAVDID